jgi:hypothetical protein
MGLWVAFSVAVLSVPGFTRLDARDDMLLDMNIPQRAIELCQRGVLLSYEGRAEEMLEALEKSQHCLRWRTGFASAQGSGIRERARPAIRLAFV